MKYVINVSRDIELLIIQRLRAHLQDDVRASEVYKQYKELRIDSTHPFALLMEAQLSGSKSTPQGLFPSITVVDDTDMKDPRAPIPTLEADTAVAEAELADILQDSARYKYVVSEQTYKDLAARAAAGEVNYASGAKRRQRHSMVMEVWDHNQIVKNKLYDIVRNWLVFVGRFALNRDYDIIISEDEISGQKSGNYNFDFGKTLYGGILHFEAVQVIGQFVVDTDIVPLAGIGPTVGDIHGEES